MKTRVTNPHATQELKIYNSKTDQVVLMAEVIGLWVPLVPVVIVMTILGAFA